MSNQTNQTSTVSNQTADKVFEFVFKIICELDYIPRYSITMTKVMVDVNANRVADILAVRDYIAENIKYIDLPEDDFASLWEEAIDDCGLMHEEDDEFFQQMLEEFGEDKYWQVRHAYLSEKFYNRFSKTENLEHVETCEPYAPTRKMVALATKIMNDFMGLPMTNPFTFENDFELTLVEHECEFLGLLSHKQGTWKSMFVHLPKSLLNRFGGMPAEEEELYRNW